MLGQQHSPSSPVLLDVRMGAGNLGEWKADNGREQLHRGRTCGEVVQRVALRALQERGPMGHKKKRHGRKR